MSTTPPNTTETPPDVWRLLISPQMPAKLKSSVIIYFSWSCCCWCRVSHLSIFFFFFTAAFFFFGYQTPAKLWDSEVTYRCIMWR